MRLWALAVLCCGLGHAQHANVWTYWIQPCTAAIAKDTGCHEGDPELELWALEAWKTAAGSALALRPASSEQTARLRLYWANGREKLYGEMRPLLVQGQRGAEVFVLPAIAGTEDDPLLRDAIVYLTCLHESGHALGLPHTRNFEDIMYSFQYGGDVPAYFGRYRRTVTKRADIHGSAGLSNQDRAAIAAVLH